MSINTNENWILMFSIKNVKLRVHKQPISKHQELASFIQSLVFKATNSLRNCSSYMYLCLPTCKMGITCVCNTHRSHCVPKRVIINFHVMAGNWTLHFSAILSGTLTTESCLYVSSLQYHMPKRRLNMEEIVRKYKYGSVIERSENWSTVFVVNGATWVLTLLNLDSLIQTKRMKLRNPGLQHVSHLSLGKLWMLSPVRNSGHSDWADVFKPKIPL